MLDYNGDMTKNDWGFGKAGDIAKKKLFLLKAQRPICLYGKKILLSS